MSRTHAVLASPLGSLTAVHDADGALVGLYQSGQKHLPTQGSLGVRDDGPAAALATQLEEYFAGTRREFDVATAPVGTEFQQQVWVALQAIPYGSTSTYGELAAAVGRPTAVRAVGAANGRNPLGIVVPCHRVVGSTGSLTGYAGGTGNKRFLLDLEAGAGLF